MIEACDRFQRQVMEEIWVVSFHGRAGSYAEVGRMPVHKRRWWFERIEKHERDKEAQANGNKPPPIQPTFPQPGGPR